MKKKKIIDFNHVCPNLSVLDETMLKRYYSYYHRLEYVYRHSFKFYRNLNIGLNITIGLLTSTSVAALFSPISPLVALVGAGVLIITGISEGLSIRQKATKAQFVYQHYQVIMNDIKSYLRGIEFDRDDLVKHLNTIDNLIADIGIPYIRKFEQQYWKKCMILHKIYRSEKKT
jgi:hypothetical protein